MKQSSMGFDAFNEFRVPKDLVFFHVADEFSRRRKVAGETIARRNRDCKPFSEVFRASLPVPRDPNLLWLIGPLP